MMFSLTTLQKTLLILLFLFSWFALISQFLAFIQLDVVAPVTELIIRYFSFFTLLTNLLIAVTVTILLWKPYGFFSRQSVQTAIASYIFIVSLIYNTLLRSIWNPQGIQMIADELLHVGIPLLYILYWLLYSTKKVLKWNAFLPWLLFPFGYMVFVLARGSFANFYPYPFMNIDEIGLQKVMLNCFGLTVIFIATFLLFLGVGNYMARKDFNCDKNR